MEELTLKQVSHFREPLLKEKDQYSWDPTFHTENYVFLFYKTTYLNEEVNRTLPSQPVRIPWPFSHTMSIFCNAVGLTLPTFFILVSYL